MSIEKPLIQKDIKALCERFDSFKDAQIQSLDIISPTQIELSLHVQDKFRDFDWISIKFLFFGIENARLVEDSKLQALSLADGITILKSENLFAFGVGECYNIESIKNSSLFIVAKTLKIREDSF